MENLEIAGLYIVLLKILETRFKEKVGWEFDKIFNRCKGSLPFQSKEILQPLRISKKIDSSVVKEICSFLPENSKETESRLLLISSLNQITFLLIAEMKEKCGIETTENILLEMIEVLKGEKKDHSDKEMIDYIKENINDFLKQIKEI